MSTSPVYTASGTDFDLSEQWVLLCLELHLAQNGTQQIYGVESQLLSVNHRTVWHCWKLPYTASFLESINWGLFQTELMKYLKVILKFNDILKSIILLNRIKFE